jgi:hypothetical protein
MRALLAVPLALSTLFTLLVLVGGVVGGQINPPPVALRHADLCVLPCWRGINPGHTFIDPANQLLLGQGYNAQHSLMLRGSIWYIPGERSRGGCMVQLEHRQAVVTETRLNDCPGLRLGDVMALVGPPQSVQPGALSLTFDGGRVRVKLAADGCVPRLSPHLPVSYISLTTGAAASERDVPWQGFMPTRAYLRQFSGVLLLVC